MILKNQEIYTILNRSMRRLYMANSKHQGLAVVFQINMFGQEAVFNKYIEETKLADPIYVLFV